MVFRLVNMLRTRRVSVLRNCGSNAPREKPLLAVVVSNGCVDSGKSLAPDAHAHALREWPCCCAQS